MGTFTDSLLKLTEFPFSYSFIGLLALIFGQGLNFGDEEFFTKLGPLLILMGFVATTLSIIDPIGALQKRVLLRGLRSPAESYIDKRSELSYPELLTLRVFGRGYYEIFWSGVIMTSSNHTFLDRMYKAKKKIVKPETEMNDEERYELVNDLVALRDYTLDTAWVVREIDKITATIYFIVVIIVFISALFLLPSFEDKFLTAFQGGIQTEGGDGGTKSVGGTNASEQAQEEQQQLGQSVQQETAPPAETTTTEAIGKDLVIPPPRTAIATTEANNMQTAIAEVDAGLETLSPIEANASNTAGSGEGLEARIIIIAFSISALVAVSYMFYRRIRELRRNAFIVFQYLVTEYAFRIARVVIKIENETLEKSRQEIEQHLTSGYWSLAEISLRIWVNEYDAAFFERLDLANIEDYRDFGIY
jgi:hypothetical protein